MDIRASGGMVSINDPRFLEIGCLDGKRGGIMAASCQARGTSCQVELAPMDAQPTCVWDRSATEEVLSYSDACVATIISLGPKSLLRSLDFRAGDVVRTDQYNTCPRIRHHQLWLQLWTDSNPYRQPEARDTVFVTRGGKDFAKQIRVHGEVLLPM